MKKSMYEIISWFYAIVIVSASTVKKHDEDFITTHDRMWSNFILSCPSAGSICFILKYAKNLNDKNKAWKQVVLLEPNIKAFTLAKIVVKIEDYRTVAWRKLINLVDLPEALNYILD